MKRRKLLTLSLSTIALLSLSSCKKNTDTSNATKINTAFASAILKVDDLNKVISKILPSNTEKQSKSIDVSNEDITSVYKDGTEYDFATDQSFSVALFNDIAYILTKYYGQGIYNVDDAIKGTCKKLPATWLQKIYDDYNQSHLSNLPTPTVAMECNVSGTEEEYIIEFACDWDFRNTYFSSESTLTYLNSILMTTGEIKYNKTSGFKELGMNYYWSGINRDFVSFHLAAVGKDIDFSTIVLTSKKDNPGWDYQSTKSATIYSLWGSEMSYGSLKSLNYHDMKIYSGKITSEGTLNDFHAETRSVSKFGADIKIEEGEGGDTFDRLFSTKYPDHSTFKVRGDKNTLVTEGAKDIESDMNLCVHYTSAKTKTFWLYKDEKNEKRTYTRAITPFEYRDTLINYLVTLTKQNLSAKNKALVERAINHLKTLKTFEYFGEFTNADDIIYYYCHDGEANINRDNVYDATKLYYIIVDLKDASSYVKFIIENGNVKYNQEFTAEV